MTDKPMYAGGEMTRQQFIDLLQTELDKSFPDEQAGFQLSSDDIDDVENALIKVCHHASSKVGGRNPNEL